MIEIWSSLHNWHCEHSVPHTTGTANTADVGLDSTFRLYTVVIAHGTSFLLFKLPFKDQWTFLVLERTHTRRCNWKFITITLSYIDLVFAVAWRLTGQRPLNQLNYSVRIQKYVAASCSFLYVQTVYISCRTFWKILSGVSENDMNPNFSQTDCLQIQAAWKAAKAALWGALLIIILTTYVFWGIARTHTRTHTVHAHARTDISKEWREEYDDIGSHSKRGIRYYVCIVEINLAACALA